MSRDFRPSLLMPAHRAHENWLWAGGQKVMLGWSLFEEILTRALEVTCDVTE